MGLPQANRLKHRQDFRAVYERGSRYNSPNLALRTLSSNQSAGATEVPPTRLGIVVSKKVSKKAVIRNRLKRQIRAAFRDLLPLLLPGWRLIVIVRPSVIECKYEHFLRELKQLLVKAEIIYGHSRRDIL